MACGKDGAGTHDKRTPSRSPATIRPSHAEEQVLREFDERLTGFQQNALRGGSLSFASPAFAEAFGQDVARFFAAAASPGDPKSCALLDSVLDGTSMLRKHFGHAPPGAERVVMEVVSVCRLEAWDTDSDVRGLACG